MNKIIAACIVACIFSACSGEKQPDHDSSLGTVDSSKATPVVMGNDSLANNPATNILPGTVQPASVTTPQQMPAQPVTTTAPGMNPPHGQPGHRCDIAVGAPLNSAPSKPATVTTPQVVTSPTATTAKTVTAPGMNPPHGEPGHRCDIAVGAPLNSPASKPTAPTVVPTVTPTLTPATPAKVDSGG